MWTNVKSYWSSKQQLEADDMYNEVIIIFISIFLLNPAYKFFPSLNNNFEQCFPTLSVLFYSDKKHTP